MTKIKVNLSSKNVVYCNRLVILAKEFCGDLDLAHSSFMTFSFEVEEDALDFKTKIEKDITPVEESVYV